MLPLAPQPMLAARARPNPDASALRELGQQLRVDAVRASAAAGGETPLLAMSAADIMAVLIARHLRVDPLRPEDPARDHLLLSNGRTGPLLTAALRAIGAIDDPGLLAFGQSGGRLEDLVSRRLPLVDTLSESLGFSLAVATGIALAMQRLEPRSSRIWLICGDDELAEGAVWEVIEAAGLPKGVFNLVTGFGQTVGEALVRHSQVDMISFTGSTRAGKRISEVAAQGGPGSVQPDGGHAAGDVQLPSQDAELILDGRVIAPEDGGRTALPAEEALAHGVEHGVFPALVEPQRIGECFQTAADRERVRVLRRRDEQPRERLPEEGVLGEEDAEGIGPRCGLVHGGRAPRAGALGLGSHGSSSRKERRDSASARRLKGGISSAFRIPLTRPG